MSLVVLTGLLINSDVGFLPENLTFACVVYCQRVESTIGVVVVAVLRWALNAFLFAVSARRRLSEFLSACSWQDF